MDIHIYVVPITPKHSYAVHIRNNDKKHAVGYPTPQDNPVDFLLE